MESQNGKVAIIVCTVDSNPLSELLLLRDGQVLAASASRVRDGEPNHRLSTASSPNSLRLEIRGIRLEDEGIYECWSRNAFGQTNTSLDLTVESEEGDHHHCLKDKKWGAFSAVLFSLFFFLL